VAKIAKGLKALQEEGRVPPGDYTGEIKNVDITKNGWEFANVQIVEAEDDEILGRKVRLFLLNEEQGISIGLQQLMIQQHWDEVPEDEEGERDTRTSLVGVKFPFVLTYEGAQARVKPALTDEDYEWQRNLMDGSQEEEEEEEERPKKKVASGSKKKTSRR